MKICVYGAASNEIDKSFIQDGERLGRALAQNHHELVFGGGASGLMGAVARGISEKGGRIVGVSPNFFNVDGILYDKCDEMIYTDTMRERKQTMEEISDAFIVTPGGIGTFEEFFEILTLKSLDKTKKPLAILNTNGYYDDLLNFLKNGVNKNFLKEENLKLFHLSDNISDIIEYIENYDDKEHHAENTRFL